MALPEVAETAVPSNPDVLLEVVRELARCHSTSDEICDVLSSPNYEGEKAQKGRCGPKFKRIAPEELQKLSALGCTQPELADWFGVSLATIERRLQRREYREVMARGRALRNISLRCWQFQVARSGHAGMLIWLGRQYLGQSNHPAPQPSEVPSIAVTYVQPSKQIEPAPEPLALPPASSAAPQSIPIPVRLDPARRDGSESTAGPRPENPPRDWIASLLAEPSARPWLDRLCAGEPKRTYRAWGGAFKPPAERHRSSESYGCWT